MTLISMTFVTDPFTTLSYKLTHTLSLVLLLPCIYICLFVLQPRDTPISRPTNLRHKDVTRSIAREVSHVLMAAGYDSPDSQACLFL